jgi:hypothetical protein
MLLEMTLAVKINLKRIRGGRFALRSGQSMKGKKGEIVNPEEKGLLVGQQVDSTF